MGVIAFLDENILAIVTAIVDVVVGVIEKRRRTGHILDPKGFLYYLSSGDARLHLVSRIKVCLKNL